MERKEALDILKRHNIWRRGADTEPTNPEQLGKALDKVIEVLSSDVSPQYVEFRAAIRLLRDLADIQNGPPLEEVKEKWNEIMNSTYDFLEQHE